VDTSAMETPSMLLCTMIRNESNYLVEWIEFHKMQGFDHVRIYDNTNAPWGSRDDHGPLIADTLVKTYPDLAAAGISVVPKWTQWQGEAFAACTKWGEQQKFDWIAVHDLDEFWFSPMHFTIKQYARYVMETQPETTVVHLHQFRYGPKGQMGPVVLPELLIETEVWRAPADVLGERMADNAVIKGEHLKNICNQCKWLEGETNKNVLKACKDYNYKLSRDCQHDALEQKTMFRTGRGCVAWIHYTVKGTCNGTEMWADPNHLRGNHYYLRSLEEGRAKYLYWGNSRSAATMRGSSTIDTGATKFFETVYDASILQWVPALKKRLHALGFDMGANDVDGLGVKAAFMEKPGPGVANSRHNLEERTQERLAKFYGKKL